MQQQMKKLESVLENGELVPRCAGLGGDRNHKKHMKMNRKHDDESVQSKRRNGGALASSFNHVTIADEIDRS